MALVISSATPLLLLDADLVVKAASGSFCSAFELDPDRVVGVEFSVLGAGEWGAPQLRSLLRATMSGKAAIEAYELDLVRLGKPPCSVILNAHKLELPGSGDEYIALAVLDVTASRQAERSRTTRFARSMSCYRSCSTASPTAFRSSPAC